MKLWKDRQVYSESFINGLLFNLEKTLLAKKKEHPEDMPDFKFDIEDLYGFAHNKKHLEISEEKTREIKIQLDIMLKNHSTR